MVFSVLKFILFTFVLPLLAINALFKKVYGYTLFQVVYGWATNFKALDPLIGLILMSVIFTPVFFLPIGSFFSALYLQVVGVKQEMMYVGAKQYEGMYIDLNSPESQPVSGRKVSTSSSASKLYNNYVMVQDPLEKGWAGEQVTWMGFGGMLAKFLFALGGGLVVLMIMIHYAEYLHAFYHSTTVNQDDLRFFRFLGNYGISLKLYWAVLLLAFPLAIATYYISIKYTGSRHIALPLELQAGGKISVIPLSVVRIQKKEYTDINREHWRLVDTPFCDVYFVSEKGYPYEIYGSVRIDSRKNESVVEEVNQAITNEEKLKQQVRVNDELYFQLIDMK